MGKNGVVDICKLLFLKDRLFIFISMQQKIETCEISFICITTNFYQCKYVHMTYASIPKDHSLRGLKLFLVLYISYNDSSLHK